MTLPTEKQMDLEEFDWDDFCPEDDEPFCDGCQNTGLVKCECGGDLCICENNGEAPCPKCHRGENWWY